MRGGSEEARAESRSPRDWDMATSVGLGESLNCKMQNVNCKMQNGRPATPARIVNLQSSPPPPPPTCLESLHRHAIIEPNGIGTSQQWHTRAQRPPRGRKSTVPDRSERQKRSTAKAAMQDVKGKSKRRQQRPPAGMPVLRTESTVPDRSRTAATEHDNGRDARRQGTSKKRQRRQPTGMPGVCGCVLPASVKNLCGVPA